MVRATPAGWRRIVVDDELQQRRPAREGRRGLDGDRGQAGRPGVAPVGQVMAPAVRVPLVHVQVGEPGREGPEVVEVGVERLRVPVRRLPRAEQVRRPDRIEQIGDRRRRRGEGATVELEVHGQASLPSGIGDRRHRVDHCAPLRRPDAGLDPERAPHPDGSGAQRLGGVEHGLDVIADVGGAHQVGAVRHDRQPAIGAAPVGLGGGHDVADRHVHVPAPLDGRQPGRRRGRHDLGDRPRPQRHRAHPGQQCRGRHQAMRSRSARTTGWRGGCPAAKRSTSSTARSARRQSSVPVAPAMWGVSSTLGS